jgi:acyl carrier protein
MTRHDIEAIVLSAMSTANLARDERQQLTVAADAPLFGQGSSLDSLGLVGLLVDIEDAFRDQGMDIELSDARAMSQARSPFRDVPSLVAYVEQLVASRL